MAGFISSLPLWHRPGHGEETAPLQSAKPLPSPTEPCAGLTPRAQDLALLLPPRCLRAPCHHGPTAGMPDCCWRGRTGGWLISSLYTCPSAWGPLPTLVLTSS